MFVGSLTSKSHNEWVDAAIAYQKEKYPKMDLIGSKNETGDDVAKAYRKVKGTAQDPSGSQGHPGLGGDGCPSALRWPSRNA